MSDIQAPLCTRRLSDKILMAFHQACNQGSFEIATQLLSAMETLCMQEGPPLERTNERPHESFVAARLRLWVLQNPGILER